MSNHAQRVFIDTNVWFSAFYGSENSKKLLTMHINDEINAVVSQKVLQELVINIKKKLPRALPELNKILNSAPPTVISDPKIISKGITALVHPKDAVILQAAVTAKIRMFITGNLKDFKIDEISAKYNVSVVSPKEAVDRLTRN